MKIFEQKCGKLLLIFLFLFMPVVQGQPKYVQVAGTHFILDGAPYYFVGTNFWYGCYLGSSGQTGNRERLVRELDRLKNNGIDNLRILGASEASTNQDAVKPAIQTSPGVYNDSLLIGLDFLLSEMNKRNMHAVIFLNNYWNWSGGMGQYLAWFPGERKIFYQHTAANTAFRKYISDLISRRNSVTGLYYYEDPAIMAWELANEPRPGSNAAYYNSFYQWIDSTAQYIHSLDSNHLVTTGNEGTMGCNGSSTIFLNAHQPPSIDYATIHLWALNWNWYDPMNPYSGTRSYSSALVKAKAYIQDHIAYARTLNKPLTMEEYGLPRDLQQSGAGTPTTVRDQYFTSLLTMIYNSAAAGSPIAGSNFWGWGGEARSPNGDYRWRVGDPFMCDPPMEAQGLNSIYDIDSSTIAILCDYSGLMAGLSGKTSGDTTSVVDHFELLQNFPNPFHSTTSIEYQIPPSHFSEKGERGGFVSLKVYDILGREVATLVNEQKSAGVYRVTFDAHSLPSGVYFYHMRTDSFYKTKKLVLLK